MPIEVELKARVRDHATLLARLRQLAHGRSSTYWDTYYDRPDRALDRAGRTELRLRAIDSYEGSRYLLTLKGAPLDAVGSPEFETEVTHPKATEAILTGLGFEHVLAYEKHCVNFTLHRAGRLVTVTLVRVPILDDAAFVEVETLVGDPAERSRAVAVVRSVLRDLGLRDCDLEPAFYLDMVASRRDRSAA